MSPLRALEHRLASRDSSSIRPSSSRCSAFRHQAWLFSALYRDVRAVGDRLRSHRLGRVAPVRSQESEEHAAADGIVAARSSSISAWAGFSRAVAVCALPVGTTNQLCWQDVAAIPLLWVVPLSLYSHLVHPRVRSSRLVSALAVDAALRGGGSGFRDLLLAAHDRAAHRRADPDVVGACCSPATTHGVAMATPACARARSRATSPASGSRSPSVVRWAGSS